MSTPGWQVVRPNAWTAYRQHIPELVVPGKALGRHIHLDSRSLAFPWRQSGEAASSKLWDRHIPILNQGNVGSCTGNALVGCLACTPLWDALTPAQQTVVLTGEAEALVLYSDAETLDGDGPYPPQDNGSSGTSASQAALNNGFISAFLHPAAVADMVDALQVGPLAVGVNWYSSFDTPDATGLVTIPVTASVRGGHEFVVRGVDVAAQLFEADNSWGTKWGLSGSFRFSWDTMARLLSEQGDCVAPLPLGVPVPPPAPAPVPAPPSPHAREDVVLAKAMRAWLRIKGV